MNITYLIIGTFFSIAGIAIFYNNVGNIKADLDDDPNGMSLKYYGTAGLLIAFGIFMIFFAK